MTVPSSRPPVPALERAVRYLAARGHSEAELVAKLHRAGYSGGETAAAVAECRRLGFLNDELYARDCAEMLASRGCGSRKILLELRRRGVAGLAEEATAELVDGEADRAMECARYKLRLLSRETDPRKRREKLWRFLLSRGFPPDIVREAAENALREPSDSP